jgi:hypothetical protein
MATINKDMPCLFVTTAARNRLPVFRTDILKGVACRALDETNALPLFSESFFMQKVKYIHLDPVRAGLVARAEDCRWSSTPCWLGRVVVEHEPLRVDLEDIVWRRAR